MPATRLLVLLPFAFFAGSGWADDCRFSAQRTLEIDAAGLESFALDTGAGDLDIEGVAGLERIELRGRACASDEDLLARLQFESRREGAVAHAATRIPETSGGFLFANFAYIDVEVRMPANLRLVLRDSSGDVSIAGVAGGIDATDSSGDLELRRVGGGVLVSDSSGDIDITDVDGDVTVRTDSSGDIEIDDVRGNALVREDSSGDIEFSRVSGDAEVGRDSSGDIEFQRIGGSAKVGADSSGGIRADDVRGDFTVERKSGGGDSIRHSGVGGRVSLPQG